MAEQVNFNVGGTRFTTTWETLQRVPGSKLSQLYQESDEKKGQSDYFFDRNPAVFGCILDFYRIGVLHLPETVCGNQIREELEFWGISTDSVSSCCWRVLYRNSGGEKAMRLLDLEIPVFSRGRQWIRNAGSLPTVIWNIMEHPQSSLMAKAYVILYTIMVAGSILPDLLMTHPRARQVDLMDETSNTTKIMEDYQGHCAVRSVMVFARITNIFFLLDLLSRFIVSPSKARFATRITNILDLVAILAAGLTVFVTGSMVDFRLLRTAKYSRFSRVLCANSGMALLILSVYRSKRALFLYAILLGIGSMLFGTVFYALEHDIEEFYDRSVPNAMYWAFVTMTTVGYGDIYPQTVLGKINACICAISGLILVAMPISAVFKNFNVLYSQYSDRDRHSKEQNQTSGAGKMSLIVNGQKI